MCPSYFRIRLPRDEAVARLDEWIGRPAIEPPVETNAARAIRLACGDDGNWRGAALFVYESSDWTVFEDLSGPFSAIPASAWLGFARSDSLVVAGYNDAIWYGEVIVIEAGHILREFRHGEDSSEDNVNEGALPDEAQSPIQAWWDAAYFVECDTLFGASDKGWLLVYEAPAEGSIVRA